ncbi:MAG: LLM class flavin-dependent oxidoreductase [Chloroflexi bacterium AL-W]|nr:LLM class flavin-dependent oxidoreductase [Chloroflexi bacterium AL-N1]NOK66360.1 LLM class flavin-dependent oxidoreductase [Chloroflexi bacterium AL-N10]NOK71748.1 LLM class flavin-dependent oxidoreductase [Chloroflexi bacterium AL-N5]NOK81005.1 LLM class flavin-dependent oxidoreductase [Chloroflexi bacterium AL-W]NOK89278.1 LLM class flavin-dependent oxidoreductase [Chloroflexi bacterium AL-N15]
MQYGFVLPSGDATTAVALAQEAEAAGWDGFFMWDPVWGIDPWVALAAVAVKTEHIRLGTLITPLSRCRPWKLASETVTLDHLSQGRVILSVGLGAIDSGFEVFGEVTDRRTRAELLDEGLDILTGLWRGQLFDYQGKHYQVQEIEFLTSAPPPTLQSPRIPIWVVGAWPRPKSMQRVVRYDGLLPTMIDATGTHITPTPDDIRAMKAYVEEHRSLTTPFDIIIEGETPADAPQQAMDQVYPYAEAGATWWMEGQWSAPNIDSVRARITQGPPRVE